MVFGKCPTRHTTHDIRHTTHDTQHTAKEKRDPPSLRLQFYPLARLHILYHTVKKEPDPSGRTEGTLVPLGGIFRPESGKKENIGMKKIQKREHHPTQAQRNRSRLWLWPVARLLCWGWMLGMLLAVSGCAAQRETDVYRYLRTPGGAEIQGEVNGFRYTAALQYYGPQSGENSGEKAGSSQPDFSLCFTSPATLRGITLHCRRENGEELWEARLGEVCLTGDFREMAIGVTDLLREEAVCSSTRVEKEIDGERKTRIEVRTQSGVAYELDAATGYPVALTRTHNGRAVSLKIVWLPEGEVLPEGAQ